MYIYVPVLFIYLNTVVLNLNIHESNIRKIRGKRLIRTTFYVWKAALPRRYRRVHHSLLHFPVALSAELTHRWRIESTEVGRARNSPGGFIYGPPSDKNLIAY